ncbi:MAG: hypothetical protein LQ349_008860 [Xanthoria aureola]|nr:MAG: hypothetical protein LQ349_008860 [Xanthoria aureola]
MPPRELSRRRRGALQMCQRSRHRLCRSLFHQAHNQGLSHPNINQTPRSRANRLRYQGPLPKMQLQPDVHPEPEAIETQPYR